MIFPVSRVEAHLDGQGFHQFDTLGGSAIRVTASDFGMLTLALRIPLNGSVDKNMLSEIIQRASSSGQIELGVPISGAVSPLQHIPFPKAKEEPSRDLVTPTDEKQDFW